MSKDTGDSREYWDGNFHCSHLPVTDWIQVTPLDNGHIRLKVSYSHPIDASHNIIARTEMFLSVKDAHALADQIRLYLAGPIERQVILAECAQRGETRLELESWQ